MKPPAETAELLPIEKMNLSTKPAYGAGDVGGAVIGILLLSYLSPFFTDVVHLSPRLAGATQLVVRIWDACIDPVIGLMSDRGDVFGAKIRERWGRRYPWMLVAAIPFGLFFILQWLIPFPETNQWGLFGFYTLVSMLLGTFFTMYSLPYTALTAELTEDYNERTNLNSFRFTFSLGGSIVLPRYFSRIGGVYSLFSALVDIARCHRTRRTRNQTTPRGIVLQLYGVSPENLLGCRYCLNFTDFRMDWLSSSYSSNPFPRSTASRKNGNFICDRPRSYHILD